MTSDPATVFTEKDAAAGIAVPDGPSDKYSRGVLGIVTGSDQYPGAAVLGTEAAVRTGVGMVRYLGGDRVSTFVLQRRPEVVTADGRVQAWLLGSGMSAGAHDDATLERLHRAVAQEVPLVVDAGALDLVPQAAGPVVVTPHYRELSALFGYGDRTVAVDAIAADPARWAHEAAVQFGCTVLLKGSTTHVRTPEGVGYDVSLATPWLSTAGSGDVLGGVLGALVATHTEAIAREGHPGLARIAATAAAVHGLAGRRASAGGPISALDVAEALPATLRDLLGA